MPTDPLAGRAITPALGCKWLDSAVPQHSQLCLSGFSGLGSLVSTVFPRFSSRLCPRTTVPLRAPEVARDTGRLPMIGALVQCILCSLGVFASGFSTDDPRIIGRGTPGDSGDGGPAHL